jgi:IS30 family transposase
MSPMSRSTAHFLHTDTPIRNTKRSGDLLSGSKNSYIATLVERHSRFAMLIKVPSKETEAVVAALSQQVRKLPATLRRSLTWDRGLEMAKHKDFTVATEVQVYFCDPQSPWRRGSNENTNLLLQGPA